MKILLIEDEPELRKSIKQYLHQEGYVVESASDFVKASEKAGVYDYDCVLVDITLPKGSGLDIVRQLKESGSKAGIIIISAKNSSGDKIQGLDLGADDYLAKPFDLEELLLRVEILLKRIPAKGKIEEQSTYNLAGAEINFDTYNFINRNGEKISLSKKETLLLKLLIDKKNQVVSREEILENVWGYETFPTGRTIDNFILSFRKNFELEPANPQHFLSVRGIGYKFVDSIQK